VLAARIRPPSQSDPICSRKGLDVVLGHSVGAARENGAAGACPIAASF